MSEQNTQKPAQPVQPQGLGSRLMEMLGLQSGMAALAQQRLQKARQAQAEQIRRDTGG